MWAGDDAADESVAEQGESGGPCKQSEIIKRAPPKPPTEQEHDQQRRCQCHRNVYIVDRCEVEPPALLVCGAHRSGLCRDVAFDDPVGMANPLIDAFAGTDMD